MRGERSRGKLVGRERTRNGLPDGTSGAEVSWLGADGIFFFFPFLWRRWGARRPDALLAPDVRALAVSISKGMHVLQNDDEKTIVCCIFYFYLDLI